MKHLKLFNESKNLFIEVDSLEFNSNILNNRGHFSNNFTNDCVFTNNELNRIYNVISKYNPDDFFYGNQEPIKDCKFNYEGLFNFGIMSVSQLAPILVIRGIDIKPNPNVPFRLVSHTISIIKGDDLYYWVFDWMSNKIDIFYHYYKCDDIDGIIELLQFVLTN